MNKPVSDIDRLRFVLNRMTPEQLDSIGVFPLASKECTDDELRDYIDNALAAKPAVPKDCIICFGRKYYFRQTMTGGTTTPCWKCGADPDADQGSK